MSVRLPERWAAYDFDEVATIASGQVDPKAPKFAGLRLVGSENLPAGGGALVGEVQSAKAVGAISGKYLFGPRQVIYSKIRPNLNKVWLSTFVGLCSADIYPIAFDESKVLAEYAYYYMLSDRFRKVAVSSSMRSGIPKVNRDDLSAVVIVAPELDEQRRIVAVLDSCDRAIALAQRSLSGTEETLRHAVHRWVFSGVRDPSAFNLMHSKKLAMNGWRRFEIAELSEEISFVNREGTALPVLSSTKLKGIVLASEYFGKQVHSSDTTTYKRVRRGEFVYATNHIEEGSVGLQDVCDEGLVSPMYTVFGVDTKIVDADFLFALLKTETYRQIFEANTSASVNRRGSLRWKDFSRLPVYLPGLGAQQEIIARIATIRRLVGLQERQVDLLRQQKLGLMQKLLTGQWRLAGDAIADLPDREMAHA
jgi:type I restriction enzyme S subunit